MMKFFIFTATIIASVAFVASSAVAHHDTLRSGGSISAILPIAVAVVLGLVWLGILDRKKRKRGSKRKHKSKRRRESS